MGRLGQFYQFFNKQKQLELLNTHFVITTLKSNYGQLADGPTHRRQLADV